MLRPGWVVAVAACIAVTGCTEDGNDRVVTSTTLSGTASTVAANKANFWLSVSNQSFTDKVVRITVAIDNRRVVEDNFDVGGQHNYFTFPFALAPGSRRVRATATNGAELVETIEIPPAGPRYAALSYWHDSDGGPRFTWTFRAEPIHFL